jgi:hypothetical protein
MALVEEHKQMHWLKNMILLIVNNDIFNRKIFNFKSHFFKIVSISNLIKEAVAYESTLGIAIKPHLSKKARSINITVLIN